MGVKIFTGAALNTFLYTASKEWRYPLQYEFLPLLGIKKKEAHDL